MNDDANSEMIRLSELCSRLSAELEQLRKQRLPDFSCTVKEKNFRDEVYRRCLYIYIPFGKYEGKNLTEIPLKYLDETVTAVAPKSWIVRMAIALVDEVMMFPYCVGSLRTPDHHTPYELWEKSVGMCERAVPRQIEMLRSRGIEAYRCNFCIAYHHVGTECPVK